MRLSGKSRLMKFMRRNMGNTRLRAAVKDLLECLENNDFTSYVELKALRSDADEVHNDGFYFFNLRACRTLILLEFNDGEGEIVWIGTHDDYESTFKNNKKVIEKWLRNKGWLD